MLARFDQKRRIRSLLISIILLTLPCYCFGIILLVSSQGNAGELPTPTASSTFTSSPVPATQEQIPEIPTNTSQPSITHTATWTASVTYTPFSTFTQTPTQTATPTDTGTPTFTPTVTSTPTSTPTFTATPTLTPTATQVVASLSGFTLVAFSPK